MTARRIEGAMVLIAVILALWTGMILGYRRGLDEGTRVGSERVNHSLPKCAEDDYLYFDHYRGPGNNTVTELVCVHDDR